jgi:hypothetical protein
MYAEDDEMLELMRLGGGLHGGKLAVESDQETGEGKTNRRCLVCIKIMSRTFVQNFYCRKKRTRQR